VRCDAAAVRVLFTAICFAAQPLAGQQSTLGRATSAFDALLEGMTCRQHKSGRMDCEFRVGDAIRFVVAGVGQEDVSVAFVQADSAGRYVASIVPLHGCIVVKPTHTAEAARDAGIPVSDSVATFAFVSPKTGKVYRNWQTCLSATRPSVRTADTKESLPDVKADTKSAVKGDAKAGADKPVTKVPAAEPKAPPPTAKPPIQ
jgi:hypothetical protein